MWQYIKNHRPYIINLKAFAVFVLVAGMFANAQANVQQDILDKRLFDAVQSKDSRAADRALNDGANMHVNTLKWDQEYSASPLVRAIHTGDYDLAKAFIKNIKNINERIDETTVLFLAIETEEPAIVKLAIEAKADVNQTRRKYELKNTYESIYSPIMTVVALDLDDNYRLMTPTPADLIERLPNRIQIANMLLDAGADPTVGRDFRGTTTLPMALRGSYPISIIRRLVERGANPNAIYMPVSTELPSYDAYEKFSCLALAANFYDWDMASFLIESGASIKRFGGHALCVAAEKQSVGYVQNLLNLRAAINYLPAPEYHDVDDKFEYDEAAPKGNCALVGAIRNPQIEVLELLLKQGLDFGPLSSKIFKDILNQSAALPQTKIEQKNGTRSFVKNHELKLLMLLRAGMPLTVEENSWLVMAAKYKYLDLARELLKRKAHLVDPQSVNPAIEIAASNSEQLFELLYPCSLNPKDWLQNWFHSSARGGYVNTGLRLLNHGADVDSVIRSETPLYVAVEEGNYEFIKFLLGRGANPNTGATDLSILNRAIGHRRDENIVIELLKAGAKLKPDENEALSISELLARAHMGKVITYLFESNNLTKNKEMLSELLILACRPQFRPEPSRWSATVEALIKAGADANYKQDKVTPLGLAARNDIGTPIVKLLLKEGADPDVYSEEKTPLFIAITRYEGAIPETIKTLIQAGANPFVKSSWGWKKDDELTPLQYLNGKAHEKWAEDLVPLLQAAERDWRAKNKGL